MGLRQGEWRRPVRDLFSGWLPVVALSLLVVVLEIAGPEARELLAFDREAILAGDLWRLASAHFVHLGVSHMILNLAGLWLVWYLVGQYVDTVGWLLCLVVVIAFVSAGLWALDPQLSWYVGLSGVLHGLLVAGLVAGFGKQRPDLWILAVAVVGKLGYEQFAGPLPGSEATSGGAVIVNAHLYGALGGVVAGALNAIRVRGRASI